MKSKKVTIYQLTFMAMMAAVTCILGPLSVPIGQIPISLTNLVIYFTVFVLGIWAGTGSYGIYLLLGAVGLPVFSGFAGGLGKLLGPTGGYLIGFIFMALIGGAVIELSHRNIFLTMLGWVVGTAVAYAFGTVWFVYLMKCSVTYALTVCVYPFIGFDIVKIVIATLLGKTVRYAITKAGLIQKKKKKKKKKRVSRDKGRHLFKYNAELII